jgi:hydroxymethylpyrimidine/phosphomethylpyrimidine kinase
VPPIAKPSFGPETVPIALTVAGSDSGAGAGIQADLKTFSALGVYGCSAITSLTAQNTCGVQDVFPVAAEFVAKQMHSVLSDMPVAAIKTGMLANAQVIQALVSTYDSCYPAPLVVDPVMLATSGDRLLEKDAVEVMIRELLPRATLITPNLLEAAALLGEAPAQSLSQREHQAKLLLALGPQAVLLKGGHDHGPDADDLLLSDAGLDHFSRPRVSTRNTHGTGCTLAAAITAGLAKGLALPLAVGEAKEYLQGALLAGAGRSLGSGASPVDHFYRDAR